MTEPESPEIAEPADALAPWRAAWPRALAAWSRYTRLSAPQLCETTVAAANAGLQGSFAMIRLADQRVVIDLEAARALGLAGLEVEILAHEIGHHVLAPASVTDHLRLLARIRRGLPTLERHAPLVANLYTDLLINDRLQRQAGLRMADVFARLGRSDGKAATRKTGLVWQLYLGICEQLWQRPGELATGVDPRMKAALATDAWLGARVVRVYANDWLEGAGRFAALLLPYLVQDMALPPAARSMLDTLEACEGADPTGIIGIDAGEEGGAIHPVRDSAITGLEPTEEEPSVKRSGGQRREPFEFGEILRAAGIRLSESEVAIRYYRELALPYLVPFPTRAMPQAPEAQMEALEPWSVGDPLDEIDWLHSVMLSPRPIPGLTTLRRSYGLEPAMAPRPEPVDLDMFVDSSASMPNPRISLSYPALAGAIIALSALRAGAAVRVTLWSGKRQVLTTPGFVRDERAILEVLTGFFGGNTAFPIHQLRDTYCGAGLHPVPRTRLTHLLMISDNGIDTMFDKDERRNSGWDVAASALAAGGAGGTMALELWRRGQGDDPLEGWETLQRAVREQGWQITALSRMEDLTEFARRFSRQHYAGGTP